MIQMNQNMTGSHLPTLLILVEPAENRNVCRQYPPIVQGNLERVRHLHLLHNTIVSDCAHSYYLSTVPCNQVSLSMSSFINFVVFHSLFHCFILIQHSFTVHIFNVCSPEANTAAFNSAILNGIMNLHANFSKQCFLDVWQKTGHL